LIEGITSFADPPEVTREAAPARSARTPTVASNRPSGRGSAPGVPAAYDYKLEGVNLEEFIEKYPTVGRWQGETAWQWDNDRFAD
jgi:hypothetical protein